MYAICFEVNVLQGLRGGAAAAADYLVIDYTCT